MRQFLDLLALAAFGLTAFVAARSMRASTHPPPDLVVDELRLGDLPSRQIQVTARVVNRGATASIPTTVSIRSGWGSIAVPLVALEPGEQTKVSFVSPPVARGDHSVVLRIDPIHARLDADESNGVRSGIIRVGRGPSPGASGPIAVPAVIGRSRADATRTIRRAGLSVAHIYRHSSGLATEIVDQQWPAAGRAVPWAFAMVLVVGARAKVPDTHGLSLDEARSALRHNDLEVGPLELRRSFRMRERRVIAQDPLPAVAAAMGSGVRLTVIEPYPIWPLATGGLLGIGVLGIAAVRPSRRRGASPSALAALEPPGPEEPVAAHEEPPAPNVPSEYAARFQPPAIDEPRREEPTPQIEPSWPLAQCEGQWDVGSQVVKWTESDKKENPRCQPRWDPGRQVVTWNHETAQPTIRFVLGLGAGEQRVVEDELHPIEPSRSQ